MPPDPRRLGHCMASLYSRASRTVSGLVDYFGHFFPLISSPVQIKSSKSYVKSTCYKVNTSSVRAFSSDYRITALDKLKHNINNINTNIISY